jgi:hypothetical protein
LRCKRFQIFHKLEIIKKNSLRFNFHVQTHGLLIWFVIAINSELAAFESIAANEMCISCLHKLAAWALGIPRSKPASLSEDCRLTLSARIHGGRTMCVSRCWCYSQLFASMINTWHVILVLTHRHTVLFIHFPVSCERCHLEPAVGAQLKEWFYVLFFPW